MATKTDLARETSQRPKLPPHSVNSCHTGLESDRHGPHRSHRGCIHQSRRAHFIHSVQQASRAKARDSCGGALSVPTLNRQMWIIPLVPVNYSERTSILVFKVVCSHHHICQRARPSFPVYKSKRADHNFHQTWSFSHSKSDSCLDVRICGDRSSGLRPGEVNIPQTRQ